LKRRDENYEHERKSRGIEQALHAQGARGEDAMSKPVNCDGCGACCMYFMISLDLSRLRGDEIAWYEMHGVEVRKNGLRFNIPCRNFDFATRRCKIYETRPRVCREAQVGAANCLASRLHMKSLGVKIDDTDDKI